jgi:hypothetical protein
MWYDGDLMVLDHTANAEGGTDYEQVLNEALVNEGAHTKVRLPRQGVVKVFNIRKWGKIKLTDPFLPSCPPPKTYYRSWH